MSIVGKQRDEQDGDRLILEFVRVFRSLASAADQANGKPVQIGAGENNDAAAPPEQARTGSINPGAYYTPEQIAAYFHLAPKTLASWRSSGEGPPFHKLGRILYRGDDVLAWSASRRAASTAAAKEKKRATA